MKQIRMRGAAALLSLALTLPLMLPGWTARAAALEESGVAISEETFPRCSVPELADRPEQSEWIWQRRVFFRRRAG